VIELSKGSSMKVLLIYPKYPDTFWSFKHVLKFMSKKATYPPLGLLTIAAMLPGDWEKKLVDMNVSALEDGDIKWADCVFISAMITQKESAKEVVRRCNSFNTKVVAGGPAFTTGHEEFEEIDHFVLGEAEAILPQFLEDFQKGQAKPVYVSDERPDITHTPVPLWELINVKHYASMPVQYSRGCPNDCEFCDITVMNGRVPRHKKASQVLSEFRAIYKTGFRGSVFIVDDNFIGNKNQAKKMLAKTTRWQKRAGYPFALLTQASLNLADDEELMRMMVDAGFNRVFIGLETPFEESLAKCNKSQNQNRDMVAAVKKIQNRGMEVLGGFIVGFDNDPPSIFENQISFIQTSGVVTAMVGVLGALPGTRLYNRLKEEGRLIIGSSGNNTDGSLSFAPRMDAKVLMDGYHRVLRTIYSPQQYYQRISAFLDEYKPIKRKRHVSRIFVVSAGIKSIWYLGIVERSRRYYWQFMTKALFKYCRAFPEAAALTVYGFHFRKVVEQLQKQASRER
jgi:radical SAM superfamily enzyme YgiQ (UPF0313 family)